MRKDHHPKLLQSMLSNFSYSLVLLDTIVTKATISKNNHAAMNHNPQFQEIVLTILGLTALLSVCDKTAIQYNQKELKLKLKSIKRNFNYEDIRDILTHWDEYSLGTGNLQIKKIVSHRPPVMSYGIHDTTFTNYAYNINLLSLFEKIMSVYNQTYEILKNEDIRIHQR